MLKILQSILIKAVIIIVAFHTIIPHPHSDELSKEKHFEIHSKSNSLIGIIRLIFHESNDESLDNLLFAQYHSVRKVDIKFKYPFSSVLTKALCIVEKNGAEATVNYTTIHFERLFFVKENGLRGPPSAI